VAAVVLALRDRARGMARGRFAPLWKWLVLQYWRVADHLPLVAPPLFAQLRAIAPFPVGTALRPRRVLFVSTRQERDQVTITTVLAGALQLRGHEVSAVHCDRVIPSCCDTGSFPGLDPATCEMCFRFARKVRDTSGLRTTWLSSLVTERDWSEARALVGGTDASALHGFESEGLPIGELARHSVAHFIRSDEIDDPLALPHYRDWIVGGIVLARAWKRLLAKERPDVVVMLSGYFMPERIAFEIARGSGTRVVTYEIGTGSETLVFDHDHLIDYDLEWEWIRFRDTPLTPDEAGLVRERMDQRRMGRSHLVNYWPTRDEDRRHISGALALAERPTAVLYTNLTWDSAVFGKDVMFPSMEAWAVHTIRWFGEHPEAQLIVRIHPAEEVYRSIKSVTRVILERVGELPPNVKLVDSTSPFSSYVLAELADFGLVYTSTMGLELPLLGKQVVVCGDAHYRDRGFTMDPTTIAAYDELLMKLIRSTPGPLAPREQEMALRYAHYFFFKLGRPVRFLRYTLASEIPALRITSAAELQRGHDAVLDRICRAIIDGGSFIVDE
jgi:capsular polysaccharide biosynthesis protein